MPKKKKKPYFPNNYDAVSECPAEFFHPIEFEEFMDWKIGGYEIPSSINSIIREHNLETGKVTEYVYQTAGHAKRKCKSIMKEGVSEFVVCTEDQVHFIYPEPNYDPFEDPLA